MKANEINVLLTGATGGIGKAIAIELVKQGASILATANDGAELSKLHAELIQHAKNASAVEIYQANLLEVDELNGLVEYSQSLPFGINTLINNAGMMNFGMFGDQSAEQTSRLVQLNVLAPMLLVRGLLPSLIKRSEAQILNIGSTFGSIGYPGFVSYSASKSAMQGFSESLKRECYGSNLSVKYISPRATQTELNPINVVKMNKELNVTMDRPEVVSEAVLKLLKGKHSTHAIGSPEKIFIKLNKLFPSLLDMAIARQLPIIKRYATA